MTNQNKSVMTRKRKKHRVMIKEKECKNNSQAEEVNLHRKQPRLEVQVLGRRRLNISKTTIRTEMCVRSTNFKSWWVVATLVLLDLLTELRSQISNTLSRAFCALISKRMLLFWKRNSPFCNK